MKRLRKVTSVILAGLLAAAMLTSCSGNKTSSTSSTSGGTSSDSGKNQTITFWNVFTGSDGDILREIVSKYNSENKDGVKIEMTIMPNDQFQQKLPAAIATNTAPDMVLFGVEYMASYVKSGSLEDISDFWDTMGVDKSNFYDNVVKQCQVDGKQYGIPMQYNVSYLYWNKDLFKAAGLDPESPPKPLMSLQATPSSLQYLRKSSTGCFCR